MKSLIAAALLLTAPVQAAPPAAPPCVTPAEVEHATLFMIPPVLDGLADLCRPSLPATAYLLTGGAERSRQLAADRALHWDAARAAIVRIAGEKQAGAFGADTANGFIRDIIKAQGTSQVSAEDCGAVDRALNLLSPLPPENLAGLVTLALETGMRKSAQPDAQPGNKRGNKTPAPSPMPAVICPAPAAAHSTTP